MTVLMPDDMAGPELALLDNDTFAATPVMTGLAAVPVMAVALSGGPDSMALLALCAHWAAARGAGIHALTVDHNLRTESADEARRVGGWAMALGVEHYILTRDHTPEGRIMERARDDRYAMMAAWCAARDIKYLLTAHHADDQAETFLFRLAKGSGLDGLAAIRPLSAYDQDLTLVRPLLSYRKNQLLSYCRDHDLPYVQDPTNGNQAYARSRLRAAMGILGAEGLTPKRLAQTAMRLARARTALDEYARRADKAARIFMDAGLIAYDYDKLAAEPEETRRRVLLIAMQELQRARRYGPRLERLEDLCIALFDDPHFTRATLGGFIFGRDRTRGRITVTRE